MVHIVWLLKYRKRILKDTLAKRVEELIKERADVNRWSIEELNVQPDHVHLVLQFRSDVLLGKIVQLINDKSSRVIRQEFPSLKEFYWGDSFGADGFFAETSGTCDLGTIKNYVKNQ